MMDGFEKATPTALFDDWMSEQQGTMTRLQRLFADVFPSLLKEEKVLLLSWLRDAVGFGLAAAVNSYDPSREAKVRALLFAAREARKSLYNGFEPDNQSAAYYRLDAALKALEE
jgi:hypothetical protein